MKEKVLILLLSIIVGSVLQAETQSISTTTPIAPPDVFRLVQILEAEIDLVRNEMGRPKYERAALQIQDAQPREVYFQANSLLKRTGQLLNEHTLSSSASTEQTLPEGITPSHVYQLVNQSLEKMRTLKGVLKIPEKVDVTNFDLDAAKVPSDVYIKIVHLNRQVDILLDNKFSSSHAYQAVTRGIAYCSSQLSLYPDAPRIPKAPPLERGKRPFDVMERIKNCYLLLIKLQDATRTKHLKWDLNTEMESSLVTPGEVYDIATLIESELAFLHNKSQTRHVVRRMFYPGKKTPSQVYQRVGILEKQLEILLELQRNNP